jgi:hypothetical protein
MNVKNIDLGIRLDLHVNNIPNYEKVGSGMPSVSLYVCIQGFSPL